MDLTASVKFDTYLSIPSEYPDTGRRSPFQCVNRIHQRHRHFVRESLQYWLAGSKRHGWCRTRLRRLPFAAYRDLLYRMKRLRS
jgi:hypothetical protein